MLFLSKIFRFQLNWTLIVLIFNLFNGCVTEIGHKIRRHPEYSDLMCEYPRITSLTKLRDEKYFLTTTGSRFWLMTETDEVTYDNSIDLKNITTDWTKVDASTYFGLDVECGLQFKDMLVLVNYNEINGRNEIVYGSVMEWNWTHMKWNSFQGFTISRHIIDWYKSIDGIAVIDDTIYIFQDQKQVRVDCILENNVWTYKLNDKFRDIPVNGPVDDIYFEEQQKETLPLYVFRRDSYYICYIKTVGDEYPVCETFNMKDSPMLHKPMCSSVRDPNSRLISSLFVQMLILFALLIVLVVFSVAYLYNYWTDSDFHSTLPKKDGN